MQKTNAVGWFDIYVKDMDRAMKFYKKVCKLDFEEIIDPTGETKMMAFHGDMNVYGSSGALVKSKFQKPGSGGTMVYFSVDDCARKESELVSVGGKLLRPKFSIGKFGFVTLCEDSEGNAFGLSSMK